MKKITMLTLFLVVMVFSLNAEIFRVNNTPTAFAPYSSIDAAVTAATAGDTILVEGGDYSYSIYYLRKSLTILGPGNSYSNNANWNNSRARILGDMNIQSGAEGTIISGFGSLHIQISCNNVTIENSIGTITSNGATDLNIRRCIVNLDLSGGNVICHNCKISTLENSSELYLFNNVITMNYSANVQNTYAYNNIFTSSGFAINQSTNIDNIFQYNVCAGDFLSPFMNNILNVNMDTQFTQGPNDTYYELTNDSVAIGAGMNGEDCGMFGGVTPYTPDGLPWQIPTITEFEVTESANSINVQIGAKNNPSPTNSAPESDTKRD